MIKKLIMVVLMVLMIQLPALCQVSGSLESESNFQENRPSTQFQWWIQGNFNEKFGYFGWALVSKDWSEIYPGIFWQPASWLQIGIGAGIEQDQSKVRLGEFIWVGKSKAYFLGFLEHSGSGLWFRAMAMYHLNQNFQVGLMLQHKLGIGPKAEVEFYKPFSFWIAVLTMGQDPETTVFAGLKLGF